MRCVAASTVLAAALLAAGCGAGPAADGGTATARGPALAVDFPGANVGAWTVAAPGTLDLTIRTDTNADDYRWYSFRVQDAPRPELTFRITNAGGSNASGAWAYNRPVVSEDGGSSWRRIADTAYDDGVFTFTHTAAADSVWIAYNPAYGYARWTALIDSVADHPMVASVDTIAASLDAKPIHMLTIGEPAGDSGPAVWAVARQHPAETGGSWMAEGFLHWLLGDSPGATALRRRGSVRLVGFMNPDGVIRGHYRTNVVGRNLNREWDAPDPATAPSVAAVQREIREFVDAGGEPALFVDFHAHSTYRRNFFFYNGAEATTPAMAAGMEAFIETFHGLNPDFTVEGSSASSELDTRIAKNWAYEALGVHAITFESSYQDVTYGPHAGEYMTTDRLRALGRDFGRAVADHFYGYDGMTATTEEDR